MAAPIETQLRTPSYTGERYRDVQKKVEAGTRHEAFVLFENAKKRLNDINNWQLFCGKTPAEFQLTDSDGNISHASSPETGNLIRVKCFAGERDKFIWYRIEEFIHEKNLLKDTEDFGFRVKRIAGPGIISEQTEGITCTFIVTRSGRKVSAVEAERSKVTVKGRIPAIERLKERVQSVFSWISSSNPQWKSLINGVLQY